MLRAGLGWLRNDTLSFPSVPPPTQVAAIGLLGSRERS
jgi:hypothetical protein